MLYRIYDPTPHKALGDRQYRPFRRLLRDVPVGQVATFAGGTHSIVYSSPALDTKGFGLQNAFVGLSVLADNRPNELIEFHGQLVGSSNSGGSRAADSTIFSGQGGGYTGPGDYAIPLLRGSFLATETQFLLRVATLDIFPPGRLIDIEIDGVLASGPPV